MNLRPVKFLYVPLLALLSCVGSFGDVPTPPAPPSPPGGYCSSIYNELNGYIDSFNQTLGNPAPYPTLQLAQLQMADSNTGPAISGANYLSSVLIQVQQLKAMGFQGVKIEVAFPILYEPFWGSQTAMQPYLTFYQQLAQNIHSMGLKLLVENNVTLAVGNETGWSNVAAFYATLNWNQFIAARATMAGTVAQYMQPDFLMLSEEPDNEALNAGQPNLNNPSLAAAMIAGEITSARLASLTTTLGAGFGTWMGPYSPSGLLDYLSAYVTLPLDYIDMHIYPINTEYGGISNLLQNALVIADGAHNALKPVAVSEAWPWKMEDAEFNVVSTDVFRSREPFSFWAPVDTYFVQTMIKLANYSQMLYMTSQGNNFFLAYQTYGGTTTNGGAANCTCTTATCSGGDIVASENMLAINAGQASTYTTTGFAYNNLLVNPLDETPPSAPSNLTGTAGYGSSQLTWTGSADNIGIAGYNVYRCSPAPCTGTWIANSTITSFVDQGLTAATAYQYQIRAFDMANNESPMTAPFTLTTAGSVPPSAPTIYGDGDIAEADQPGVDGAAERRGFKQVPGLLGQFAERHVDDRDGAVDEDYILNQPLSAGTTYYYGVIAVESNLNLPMSPGASATTLPLPESPTEVVATPTSSTKITLTWKETTHAGGLPIASYQVYRGTTDGIFAKASTVTTTTYTNSNLAPSTTYYFEVIALDTAFDQSAPSSPVSATTMGPPPAPTNLTATTPAATQIVFTWQWTPAPGGLPAARYLIYCGSTPTNLSQIGTATATTYTYRSAMGGTTYYCDVVAVDTSNQDSAPSTQIAVTTPPMPAAPTNVQAVANSSTSVTASWTETIPTGGLPIQTYTIYRGTSPSTLTQVGTKTASPYTDKTVTTKTTYYYAISATDTGRDVSAKSAVTSVTTP